MRRIRKLTVYACTMCYQLFPTAKDAKQHAEKHPAPKAALATKPKRATKAGRILEAVKGGAKTAKEVSDKTGIRMGTVHSYLAYHRRRGNVKGGSGHLRAAP